MGCALRYFVHNARVAHAVQLRIPYSVPDTLSSLAACLAQGELPTLTDPWVREDLTSQYHRDLPSHTWLGLRSYGDGQVRLRAAAAVGLRLTSVPIVTLHDAY